MNTKINTDTTVTTSQVATDSNNLVRIKNLAAENSATTSTNNLVFLHGNMPVTTSLQVAEVFDKSHDNVIKAIKKANQSIQTAAVNFDGSLMFQKSIYKGKDNTERTMYYLNRDGLTYLVMGFTGDKATVWKLRYIEEFNRMEQYIRDQQKQKPMSHLEVTLANAQALVDHEKRITQNTADIAELKKAIVHPFSRTNMAIASNTRKIKDHEERIVNLESFGEDKGPAEDLKSLISEAHRRSGQQISYQDLYMQFYTSLKDRFTVDIWARLRSLKTRRKKEGWAKSKVDKLSTLDAITANPDIWRAMRQGIQLVRTQWLQEDTNREED